MIVFVSTWRRVLTAGSQHHYVPLRVVSGGADRWRHQPGGRHLRQSRRADRNSLHPGGKKSYLPSARRAEDISAGEYKKNMIKILLCQN